MGERRESKKRETRERISDVATAMFFERGFETVTLDEVAAAAKVSKMTVFNYFARKEDLILDREDDLLLLPFRKAIRERPKGQSAIDALRMLIDEMSREKQTLARIDKLTAGWWRVVSASPSLKARLRELADEATEGLALELGGAKPDGASRLRAGMIVLAVRTAREEAFRVFERTRSPGKASATLLSLIEQGFTAVEAVSAGSR